MANEEYKQIYLSEAAEIIKELNNKMVKLEKNPEDQETINAIFRGAHTIKGMSATMAYDQIVKLAHAMESFLVLVRDRKAKLTTPAINLLFEAIDKLEEGIKAVSEDKVAEFDALSLSERLAKVADEPAGALNSFEVTVKLSEECQMPYARALVVLEQFKLLGRIGGLDKLLKELEESKITRSFSFVFSSPLPEHEIIEKTGGISEVESVVVARPGVSRPDYEPEKHESLTVRVDVAKLDNLMNIVGEITISKIRMMEIARRLDNKELLEVLAVFNNQSEELQQETMRMRLFPLEFIFSGFPRLVRDTASANGKEVDLHIAGSEIGLDRTILDQINEPLVHILRNAVGHGIESPEERKKAGKPERGQIYLAAKRDKDLCVIEVSDDGAGMEKEEILRVAVEKKIISEEDAQKIPPEEVFMLITNPNFSTSKQADETSGRGVGMNVVATAVESLGGALIIRSEKGKGTTFTLKLPLSVAILQSLLISLDKETYAIPISSILETIKLKPESAKKVGSEAEIFNYRDAVVPLVDLRKKFGLAPLEKEELSIILVEHNDKKVGIQIDAVLGQQEIVMKALKEPLGRLKGISGATILGSGKVAFILDVPALVK